MTLIYNTVRWECFKPNYKSYQQNLRKMKKHEYILHDILYWNQQLGSLANSAWGAIFVRLPEDGI